MASPSPIRARRMLRYAAAFFVVATPMMLTACADPPALYVDQAWVQVSPNPQSPSSGYFTVHGGENAVELRDVTTDRAQRVEMHESVTKNGEMTMTPIDRVAIPPKTEVAFAPGGKHLMLWNVNPDALQQGKMPLTFLFSNGDRIIVDAIVRKAGAAPAKNEPENH